MINYNIDSIEEYLLDMRAYDKNQYHYNLIYLKNKTKIISKKKYFFINII